MHYSKTTFWCLLWALGLHAQEVIFRPQPGVGIAEPSGLNQDLLQSEAKKSFGVITAKPKVYDDALLRDMLAAASARLAAISNALDAAKINSSLGAISGATLSASGFGLAVQGGPSPSVATTVKGPTGSTEQTTTTAPGAPTAANPNPGSSTTSVDKTVSGVGTTDTVTTRPSIPVPTATAPASSLSLPSSLGPSSSDLLNEQVQLMAEIANLRLLLDGALSDQIIKTASNQRVIRKRLTIGIPVTVSPTPLSKDRVTIVEVLAWSPAPRYSESAPAITALLPKDKTYNVASITDRNMSLSGGAVIGVLGASASYTRSRRTWFVVAAQDTVAMNLGPWIDAAQPTVRFAWQLRPVLRQQYLRAGTRELMVQLAPPTPADAPYPISLNVRTYLRKYNQKTGLVGDVVDGSVSEWKRYAVPQPDLRQDANLFSTEHLGDGTVLVNIHNRFLNGTYIRVGNRRITEGAGLTLEAERLRFTATVTELANREVVVVSRDGTETPIQRGESDYRLPGKVTGSGVPQGHVRVSAVFDSPPVNTQYAIVAGELAYRAEKGKDNKTYWADIPAEVLKAKPNVRIQVLLCRSCQATLDFKPEEKDKPLQLTLISRSTSLATFLLTGKDAETATLWNIDEVKGAKLVTKDRTTILVLSTPEAVSSIQSIMVTVDGKQKNVAVPQPPKPDPPACCVFKPAA